MGSRSCLNIFLGFLLVTALVAYITAIIFHVLKLSSAVPRARTGNVSVSLVGKNKVLNGSEFELQ